MALSFRYDTYIASTPQKVWEALTSGDATRQYFFGRRVESSWKVESDIIFWTPQGEKDIVGEILEIEPGRRLSYTFEGPGDTHKRDRLTRATFTLKAMGPMTKLSLVHDNLIPADLEPNPDVFQGLNNGWPAILSNLKTYLETGKAFAFPGVR
jgi:uncharacterized protein YndB with AHSA1/START domain